MSNYIGAIDQGTTSTRFIVFDHSGKIVSVAQKEHEQIYPKPGWVEHDPEEIWQRTQEVISEAMQQRSLKPKDLAAIGITNQRETTILWNRKTGKPVANALVWQDTRVEDAVAEFHRDGGQDRFRRQTGLPLATYFSGLKIRWVLKNVPGVREQFVGIGTLVAAAADGGGDRVDSHSAIAIDDSLEVAKAVGGRRPRKTGAAGAVIVAGGIDTSVARTGNGVGSTEVQAVGQSVGELPLAEAGVEYPLLESSRGVIGGRGGSVEAGDCGAGIAAAFVGDIERGGVGKPDAEGIADAGVGFRFESGKAFQDAHVVRLNAIGL